MLEVLAQFVVKGEGSSSCVMKPRILSWNVRGLNKRSKCIRISNLLRDWKVDIICFQETKGSWYVRVVLCTSYEGGIMWIGAV
jgi:hypothetical protein